MTLIKYTQKNAPGIINLDQPRPIHNLPKEFKQCDLWLVDVVNNAETSQDEVEFVGKTSLTLVPNDECKTTLQQFDKSLVRFKAYFDCSENLPEGMLPVEIGDTLVKTDYPWSARSVGKGEFKGKYATQINFTRPAENQLNRIIDRLSIEEEDELALSAIANEVLIRRARKVSYDPWESRKQILTAAIYESEYEKIWAQQRYRIQDLKGKRALGGKTLFDREVASLTAVVRNYDKVFLTLMQAKEIEFMLNQAETGQLQSTNGTKIAPEFANKAQQCLELSIRQALGGPYDDEAWSKRHGRKVVPLVRRIFYKHAANFTSFIKREMKKGGGTDGDFYSPGSDIFGQDLDLDDNDFLNGSNQWGNDDDDGYDDVEDGDDDWDY